MPVFFCPYGSGNGRLCFCDELTELILLSTVQGLAFGIATTAGITLAIDITNSTLRSAGNVSFSWIARLGMILGIILGVWFDQHYAFKTLLTVSVTTGALGILTVAGVYVPFRAPFVTKLYSFDRFLLLRGWVPAINLILITFIPGLLIPLVHPSLNDIVLGDTGVSMPFFAGVGMGYLASLVIARLFILKEKTLRLVIMGLGLEILAICLLKAGYSSGISSVLLGLGLGLIMPEFLVMFVKLSHHCQRGTANTTHLLAGEVRHYTWNCCCVLYGYGYRSNVLHRTNRCFGRLIVLCADNVSILYQKESEIRRHYPYGIMTL